jgi:hypothetical protein
MDIYNWLNGFRILVQLHLMRTLHAHTLLAFVVPLAAFKLNVLPSRVTLTIHSANHAKAVAEQPETKASEDGSSKLEKRCVPLRKVDEP